MPANARLEEVAALGHLSAAYSNLEVGLLNCVANGTGDFNNAFKAMFRPRGETRRINVAEALAVDGYRTLGLEADFLIALAAMRHALDIRNQYAHWTWWDDLSGLLAIANLEDLAKDPQPVDDFANLRAYHVSLDLLAQQNGFFDCVDECLAWVNYEGRFRSAKLANRVYPKPLAIARPDLFRP